MPTQDPLRSLVYTAADRAIDKVFIAGRQADEITPPSLTMINDSSRHPGQ